MYLGITELLEILLISSEMHQMTEYCVVKIYNV